MKYVLLNIVSDISSFGYNDRGYNKTMIRNTLECPTKSAIYGMICTSFGKSGILTDFFKKLNKIIIEVYSYNKNNVLEDLQNIGGSWIGIDGTLVPHSVRKNEFENKRIKKSYLINSKFIVLLKIEDDSFAEEIVCKLKKPHWDVYFGRKNCVPTQKIFKGCFDKEEEAMKVVFNEQPICKYHDNINEDYDECFEQIRDVPTVSFDDKNSYSPRRLFKKFL